MVDEGFASAKLTFSPDEKYMYIDNSEPQKLFLRYDVNPDGTLSHRTVFHDVTSSLEPGLPDALKVHRRDNVYGAAPGRHLDFFSYRHAPGHDPGTGNSGELCMGR